MSFLDDLTEFKVETINDKTWNKLRKNYISNPDFNKEKVLS